MILTIGFWASIKTSPSPVGLVYANPSINNHSVATLTTNEQEQIAKSSLLFSPSCITAMGDTIVVYDEFDGYLKFFDLDFNFQHSLETGKVLSLSNANNLIFVLTDTPEVLVIDNQSKSIVTKITKDERDTEFELTDAKKIFAYKENDEKVYVLVSKYNSTQKNSFELYTLNYETTWSFENSRLSIDKTRVNIDGEVESIFVCESNEVNKLNIIFTHQNKVSFFSISPEEKAASNYVLTNLYTSSSEAVYNFVEVIYNTVSYYALTENNKLYLLSFSTTPSYHLNKLSYVYEDNYGQLNNCHCTALNNKIYYCDKTNSQINVVEFKGTKLAKSGELTNKPITLSNLATQNYKFYALTNQTKLLESPFNLQSGTMLNQGAHVCEISEINIDGAVLNDFVYCLYTNNGNNYYGYIEKNKLELLVSTYNQTSVTVYSQTPIYKLPSKAINDANNSILTTPIDSTRFNVIPSNCNNTYTGDNTKFIMIEIDENEVGFVDITRTTTYVGETKVMVTNNATIKKDVKVYSANSTDSPIIDTILKGNRVKVVGKTDKQTKLIKIVYNNQNGEEITGYIHAESVSTDGWSVLQIVGLVLIFFNILFLGILLYIRKKINND